MLKGDRVSDLIFRFGHCLKSIISCRCVRPLVITCIYDLSCTEIYTASLKLGQYCLRSRNLDKARSASVTNLTRPVLCQTYSHLSSRLLLRIDHFAMVNDHRVPRSPLAPCPANSLGELYVRVREEQLLVCHDQLDCFRVPLRVHYRMASGLDSALTISSPLIPFALPQALITQASLNAITATISTPLDLIFERFWI